MNGFKLPVISLKKAAFIVGACLVVIVILFVAISSMGTARQSTGFSSGSVASFAPPMIAFDRYEESSKSAYNQVYQGGDAGYAIIPPVPSPETPPQDESMIVKTGDLGLLVADVNAAHASITAIRIRVGGEQGDASFTESRSGMRSGDVSIWVPAGRFDEAMSDLKKLAIRVERESVSASDVSSQYVDMEARLKNLRVTETQFAEIMKRAGTISDVLSVAQALSNTRSEIERLEAQLAHLARRVALSSIHISLSEEAKPASAISSDWRPMVVAKTAFGETLKDLTSFVDGIIMALIKLPVLLLNIALWFGIIFLLWRSGRFVYRRYFVVKENTPEGGNNVL